MWCRHTSTVCDANMVYSCAFTTAKHAVLTQQQKHGLLMSQCVAHSLHSVHGTRQSYKLLNTSSASTQGQPVSQ
jgi:hypothetical protein